MTTDLSVSDQTYQYFLQESAELLQTMEDELQDIRTDFSVQKVHNLMRAAHTLKGASASVGLDTVKKTTHSLEDVFKALCHQDTVISVEMEGLIFQGFDCLKLLMSAQLAEAKVDEADILDRMATVVTQLQQMLGDRFGQGGHLPTSSELGFDMTQSIFEVGVAQRIETLAEALESPDVEELTELLETHVEVFIGLAESLDLPGFGDIAKTTKVALEQSPSQVLEIASVALADYETAHAAVLAGDRIRGGSPSAELQRFCGSHAPAPSESNSGESTGQAAGSVKEGSKSNWAYQLWQLITHPIGTAEQITEGKATDKNSIQKKIASVATEAKPSETDFLTNNTTETAKASANSPESLPDLSSLLGLSSDDSSADTIDNPSQTLSPHAATQPSVAKITSNNATIRIAVDQLDQLSQSIGELLTYQNRQVLYNEEVTALVKKLLNRIAQQQQQLNRQRSRVLTDQTLAAPSPSIQLQQTAAQSPLPSNATYSHFDAIELDQYSDVQLLAQSFLEETVQQSENAEAIDLFIRKSGQAIEKQKRLLTNTRETLLSARMLPLEQVFQRFPAAVERLKAQHHKQVEVLIEGGDVLVDKVIAEKLYDPLLHLVRNAFDHGIEDPVSRQQQQKAATGQITIEARQQGRHLVISVKDDGQGLNLEIIRRKAVENQIITSEEAAALTPAQTVDLLFETGFSTASEVDDLSGRGVGLDAVKAQVRSLQGWVTVSHQPGEGTCFTLQIPSSLTIAKLLLCQAQGRVYALIADAIEHILIPNPSQVKTWDGGKTLTWQANDEEHLIPVNNLSQVLHYASPMPKHKFTESRSDLPATTANPVILLNHKNALVGIEVDQLMGEQELVISPLGKTIVPPDYLYGSSILPDGQLTLLLECVMLAKIISEQRYKGTIDISLEEKGGTPAKRNQNEPVFVKKLILTVDDSITVRNSLADALQKADYQVIQAKDGAEALQQIERYPGIQAILCDIEMPGMNGFEFLKVRQQDQRIAAIPTVMLTSRAGDKHRLLTKTLGATDYLTKPYLTPQLLKTVADAIETATQQQLSKVGEAE